MRVTVMILVIGAVLFLVGAQHSPEIDVGERHRGVSWVGSRHDTAEDIYFKALVDHHINWIVQTPFGWQSSWNDPNLRLSTRGGYWGERDDGLRATTELAKKHGIKTLLKPHIWMHSKDGKWRSDIEMADEKSWALWFRNYRTFIMHYATLAQELDIEALCIGTELWKTMQREKEWRAIIADIRSVYDGELTYAGNWYREFKEVPFWDAMDYVGIQAYFPLTKKNSPTQKELVKGWQPHLNAIEELQKRTGKPVIFTEIGYRNTANNAIEPWLWPQHGRGGKPPKSDHLDPEAQAVAFRAMFDVFWDKPWFKGAYIWKWFPELNGKQPRTTKGESFSPQNQPAMQVIQSFYQQEADKAASQKAR